MERDDNELKHHSLMLAWRKTAENAAAIRKRVACHRHWASGQQTFRSADKNRSKVVLVADSVAVNCFGIDGIQRRQRGGDYSGQSRQPAMAGGAPAKDPFDDF